MQCLTKDDAMQLASRIILFTKIYQALECADYPLSPQENYLMAMAAVYQQTGEYLGDLPNPSTHERA